MIIKMAAQFRIFDRPAIVKDVPKKVDKEMEELEFPSGFYNWTHGEQASYTRRFRHYSRVLGVAKPVSSIAKEPGRGMHAKEESKNAFPKVDRDLRRKFEEHMNAFP